MKKIVLIFIFCLCNSLLSQNLAGEWDWSYGDKHFTALTLKQANSLTINGDYCSVFHSGRKIDCYDEIDIDCIKLTKISNNVFQGKFTTHFNLEEGEIRLTIINSQEIRIEVISAPSGEYYFPKSGIFKRL